VKRPVIFPLQSDAFRKQGTLACFHLSTKEMDLFTNKIPLEDKKITAEVCIHHLWFTNDDYATG
jgi:dihydroorotase-like cyclic amidohydrolase